MKKILDSRIVRDSAVYIGIGVPYGFLLESTGTLLTGYKGMLIMLGLYICIDLAKWGLKK